MYRHIGRNRNLSNIHTNTRTDILAYTFWIRAIITDSKNIFGTFVGKKNHHNVNHRTLCSYQKLYLQAKYNFIKAFAEN